MIMDAQSKKIVAISISSIVFSHLLVVDTK